MAEHMKFLSLGSTVVFYPIPFLKQTQGVCKSIELFSLKFVICIGSNRTVLGDFRNVCATVYMKAIFKVSPQERKQKAVCCSVSLSVPVWFHSNSVIKILRLIRVINSFYPQTQVKCLPEYKSTRAIRVPLIVATGPASQRPVFLLAGENTC